MDKNLNYFFCPVITVLIPVFNSENYISECINSILNQTFTDFELLIVNDGSKDNTLNIINSFKDNRIKIIHKEENTGIVDSLNLGISLAKGKYIARMDADDIALSKRFEKQINILESDNEIILCASNYIQIGNNSSSIIHPENNDEIRLALLEGCYIAHPTVMFRKDVILDNNLSYDKGKEYCEDYDLWVKLSKYGKFYNIQESLLQYRVHKNQISNMKSKIQSNLSNDCRLKMLINSGVEFDVNEYDSLKKIFKKNSLLFAEVLLINSCFDKIILANLKSNFFNDNNLKSYIDNLRAQIFQEFFNKNKISLIFRFLKNFDSISKHLTFKNLLQIYVKSIKNKTRRILNKIIRDLKTIIFFLYIIIIKNQFIGFKRIPIIIINFNQLYYPKQLIEFLLKQGYKNIVIIDNNSTYPPLLNYYDSLKLNKNIKIHRLNKNYGHTVFWDHKKLFKTYSRGFYVVTDADIVPVKECPPNFVQILLKDLILNSRYTKVGLSLKINDIPEENRNKSKIIKWEKKFWLNKIPQNLYTAQIDTTFAIYMPNYHPYKGWFYSGLRKSYPFQAIHGGWYINSNNLTEEQKFYYRSANLSSSWLIDGKGNLINTNYSNL